MELIAVGGFADVYKAIYRDFVVAVKTMRVPQDRQLRQEFESEIRFMQTIRHENIVLFIGAGKSVVDAEPFLVTEYTQRGSLRDVLDNSELEITTLQKINFAFDAAKGMNFLHTLSPPRLHRDLKSPNLLVSHSWTVKVADFGFGRPLPEQRRSRQSGDRVSDLAVPLLEIRDELSFRNVGTIRWNAPELSLGHQYNTAVDVYSFGIVMWEIWTRQLPFQQYRFAYEVRDAVASGERPQIPDMCPQGYSRLMQQCWSAQPNQRSTFSHILKSLKTAQNLPIGN
ncbi:dual specificity protein kinase shkC-like [Corticium candelabrum]|uniref:dual specificity protein kinase shkC-like n=1 Tax=Corticium candelabrum TaxID=121492 RepID=UPI002E274DBD|nr:dual specificity protein kinase shkC-like [Corticium candelabrum]